MIVLSDTQRSRYLQHTLFAQLSDLDLKRLAEATQIRQYALGEVIVGDDPTPGLVYIVIAGRVKIITYVPDGKQQVLALLARGDLFGEVAPGEIPVAMRAVAFDQTVVVGILHRPLFEEVLRGAPEIAMRVIRILAHRMRAAEQAIQDLALRDTRGRLASLLVRLAEECGEPHRCGIRVPLRLTHRDLATMVGATRETTTSLVNRFRDEGLLVVEQRRLIIVDLDRLRAIAHRGHHRSVSDAGTLRPASA